MIPKVMFRLMPAAGAQRVLSIATFVNTVGNGLYLTTGVLYFTRVVHLPVTEVGIGLSVAGLAAMASGVLAGHLADLYGPRGVYALTLVCGAATMLAFCLVDGFWAFFVVACLSSAAQTAGPAARGPIIRRYGGDKPQEFRAYLRSVTNAGLSAGAVFAGWAVQVDTRTAYLWLIAGNALSFAASAAVVMRLPSIPPQSNTDEGPRWIAMHDAPYLTLTLLDGVMSIQYRVLTIAFPLWLVYDTTAPRWLISGTLIINTAMIVLFQVRASRNVGAPRAGGAAYRRAGFTFLVALVIIAAAKGIPAWPAAVLMLIAIAILTIGEMWHAAGSFELSFGLAPSSAQGQYLGVFGMGLALSEAIGPIVLTTLCIDWGRPGWFAVGAILALTGLIVPAGVRWAERTRPVSAEPETVIG